MNQIRKAGGLIAFAGLIFLFFLVLFESRLSLPAWVQVIGRMHPLLLHFPIVLLLISLCAFWIPEQPALEKAWEIVRLLAAVTAIATAIMGMFLSIEEAGKGDTLVYHKWTGIITATLSYILYAFHQSIKNINHAGKPVAVFTALVLILTGHWGAAVTHGDNFVSAPLRSADQPVIDPEKARIFPDVVNLVLKEKCGNCHQGGSQKGGLLLADSISIHKGGKNGPALLAGNPEKSLLLMRVHLPMSDKKHMPVADKPQLTEEEIRLLEAWIKAGAPFEQPLNARKSGDSLRMLAEAYIAPYIKMRQEEQFDFAEADPDKVAALNNNYRVVRKLGKHVPALVVSFYGKAMFSNEKLTELEPVSKQIVELNLARMPVKDEQMKWISKLPNLRRLNLNYSDITDAGLQQLSGMQQLEMISVAGTSVSMQGLGNLLTHPKLKEIFVWNTKVKPDEADAVRKKYPRLRIDPGFEGADTMLIALNKPMIKTSSAVFYDSIRVELFHPVKGTELRYTTDGTEPDSLKSPVYKAPVIVQANTELKVKAFKKGWISSEIVQSRYLKSLPLVQTKLLLPADEKYNADAERVLTDRDLGDPFDFGMKWLGYRKNEALLVMDLGTLRKVEKVTINNLMAIRASIFPPASVTVWGSKDEKNWQLLKTVSPARPQNFRPAKDTLLNLSFSPVTVRYLKLKGEPVKQLPAWHNEKGKPGWFFLSEVMVN
jgi:uncharacterized membrane protein